MNGFPLWPLFILAAAIGGSIVLIAVRGALRSRVVFERTTYEAALAEARAAFGGVMQRVEGLEADAPEAASDAKLMAAMIAKRIDEVARECEADATKMGHGTNLLRLRNAAEELTKLEGELSDAQGAPAATAPPGAPPKGLPIL